ncbi:Uncharacterised protein [Cedecea lapagei]|uniref:DUF7661 domain-containing protein n=2 Tax=Cedecea lapagei TaxID=158823 RepID=A0A447V3L9_9ENTR|nr:Uncharacterised protein [Cedecea lapagei]
MGVKKNREQWLLYRVDPNEGKYSRVYDVVIPSWLAEEELPGWLGDIYHEAANERHPDVHFIGTDE